MCREPDQEGISRGQSAVLRQCAGINLASSLCGRGYSERLLSHKPSSAGKGIVVSVPELHPDGTMKVISQDRYGSPEMLRFRETNRPVVEDNRVLVSVRAASVNPLDWHITRGLPYILRLFVGLRRPRNRVRGADVTGHVEALGKNVTLFKPGDEVFGGGRGTFAENTSSLEASLAPKPRGLTFEQAAAIPVAGRTALQPPGQGSGQAWAEGPHQRSWGRRGHVRSADRQVPRGPRHRRNQQGERGTGPFARRR
jgi:hypothetical protein